MTGDAVASKRAIVSWFAASYGFKIPFSAGHTRRMPRLTKGPVRYRVRADRYLAVAQIYASRPVKQAVISPSALSLLYPDKPLPDYPREQFMTDLLNEHAAEVRSCLALGAHVVQIDLSRIRAARCSRASSSSITSGSRA